MDLDFVSVHNIAEKEFGQFPAILISHLVNNAHVLDITEMQNKGITAPSLWARPNGPSLFSLLLVFRNEDSGWNT